LSKDLVLHNLFNPEHINATIAFQAFTEPGRQGVEVFPLYGVAQTGPDGPTAALVRYQAGAITQRHRHMGFELVLVLDGELEDDNGKYGKGALIVSEPGSDHAPRSNKGCQLLVIWEKPVQRVPYEK